MFLKANQPLYFVVYVLVLSSIEHHQVNGIASLANGVFKNGGGSVVSTLSDSFTIPYADLDIRQN